MFKKNRVVIAVISGILSFGWLTESILAADQKPETKITLESRYITESDVQTQSGQLSISETKLNLGYEYKLDNGMPISLSLAGKHTNINSDVAVYLPSYLAARSLGVGVKFPLPYTESQNYFMGLDIFPSIYSDGWDEFSSSAFRIPIRSYVIYKRDENFIVVAGLSIRPNFDTKILPLIGMIYRPNEQWELNALSDNPQLIYHVSAKAKVFLEADLVNEEYEVTRDGQKGRVLFYREFSAGVGSKYEFTKNFSGVVSVGSVFNRMLKYEDDQGKIVPKDGVYIKARFQLNF